MPTRKKCSEIIKERDWPVYPGGLSVPDLWQIADKAHRKRTLEGHLAAILIYHQISEEMLRMVLKWAQFYIQLSVFPTEFAPKIKDKLFYGQVISELDQTIDFPQKAEFLEGCRGPNGARSRISTSIII